MSELVFFHHAIALREASSPALGFDDRNTHTHTHRTDTVHTHPHTTKRASSNHCDAGSGLFCGGLIIKMIRGSLLCLGPDTPVTTTCTQLGKTMDNSCSHICVSCPVPTPPNTRNSLRVFHRLETLVLYKHHIYVNDTDFGR